MKLELVSHCWHYSRPLIFQLSSLFLYPPRSLSVSMTVVHSPSDANTVAVLRYFASIPASANVALRPWPLPDELVTRRMIGRNQVALATEADWVWFTDCDYVFREGCLDALVAWEPAAEQRLFFPGTIYQNRDHESGDRELARVFAAPSVVDVTPSEYVLRPYNRAIGGIQIVRGALAREIGYCRDSPFHHVPSAAWVPTKDDVWFRRTVGTPGTPMSAPNLYRIRHSARGGTMLDGVAALGVGSMEAS